jgi:sulfoxide reductase heme-binding subunit YedZ
VLVGSLAPAVAIPWRAVTGGLGANPIAEALNQFGLLALIFLVASLACTPLRTAFGWTWAIGLRRMLGLFSFFYAFLHIATYAGLDKTLDVRSIFADVTTRRFIFVGFAAFAILVPLAATSTAASVKRLGFARWKRLHRLVYVAGVLGVIHFIWRVKRDLSQPMTYAVILGVLLLMRLAFVLRDRLSKLKHVTRPGCLIEGPVPRGAQDRSQGGDCQPYEGFASKRSRQLRLQK